MTLKEILNLTTPAVLWRAAKASLAYAAQKRALKDKLYAPAFLSMLAASLGVPKIKKDRAGRLYCVVNPTLNDRGQFDSNMIIYELDAFGEQFSNERFIEQWLVRKLRIIQDVFKQREAFSQVEFEIRHVGPVNHDNFLLVIRPSTFDEREAARKAARKRLGFWGVAGCVAGAALLFL